jgi:hypothetical protein
MNSDFPDTRPAKVGALLFIIGVLGLCGCGDDGSAGLAAHQRALERQRTPPAPADEELYELVQTSPMEESKESVEQWLDELLNQEEGQVMFPLWSSRRKAASKYEVRFTYTVLRDDYYVEAKGVAWHVDWGLRLVGPPRILQAKDLENSRHERMRDRIERMQRWRERMATNAHLESDRVMREDADE